MVGVGLGLVQGLEIPICLNRREFNIYRRSGLHRALRITACRPWGLTQPHLSIQGMVSTRLSRKGKDFVLAVHSKNCPKQ